MPSPGLNGRRVLVTGASGFIGRHVVLRLSENSDATLRLLIRGSAGDLLEATRGRSELVRGDLADDACLVGLCSGVDVVIHCAAVMPGQPGAPPSPVDYRRINLEVTLKLATRAAMTGTKRFIFVSSTTAMGAPVAQVVDELTPCRPSSQYGITKRLAEEGLLELAAKTGLEVVIVRPCIVAGRDQRGGPLLKLFQQCRRGIFPAFGGRLDVQKPLVDVGDVAWALSVAAVRGIPGEIYLVTSGERHTLCEILEVAGRLTGNPRPYVTIPLPLARIAALATAPLARLLGRDPPLSQERLDLSLVMSQR